MSFWEFMVKKDDFIVSTMESLRRFKLVLSPKMMRTMKSMRSIPPQGIGDDLFIILNAPSLNTQDLSVLKDKTTMFVNRGFNHPLYKELCPKYHVFIDSKMLNGIWPVTWIDDILTMSPNTQILLPLSWSGNPMFKPYYSHIYWLNWSVPFYNLGVFGACISFGIQQQFSDIYFTGFDATGIAHEMVRTAGSHFYGDDSELIGKNTSQFSIDLLMHSRHLHDLNRLAKYCLAKDIQVFNLTNGGLLDMFPRKQLIPLL